MKFHKGPRFACMPQTLRRMRTATAAALILQQSTKGLRGCHLANMREDAGVRFSNHTLDIDNSTIKQASQQHACGS